MHRALTVRPTSVVSQLKIRTKQQWVGQEGRHEWRDLRRLTLLPNTDPGASCLPAGIPPDPFLAQPSKRAGTKALLTGGPSGPPTAWPEAQSRCNLADLRPQEKPPGESDKEPAEQACLAGGSSWPGASRRGPGSGQGTALRDPKVTTRRLPKPLQLRHGLDSGCTTWARGPLDPRPPKSRLPGHPTCRAEVGGQAHEGCRHPGSSDKAVHRQAAGLVLHAEASPGAPDSATVIEPGTTHSEWEGKGPPQPVSC